MIPAERAVRALKNIISHRTDPLDTTEEILTTLTDMTKFYDLDLEDAATLMRIVAGESFTTDTVQAQPVQNDVTADSDVSAVLMVPPPHIRWGGHCA